MEAELNVLPERSFKPISTYCYILKSKEILSLPMGKKNWIAFAVYSVLMLMLCCCATTALAASAS